MNKKLTRIPSLVLCLVLMFQQSGFAQIAGQLDISGYLTVLRNSFIQDKFRPLHLRYLSYDNLNNSFKLLLDKGDLKDIKAPQIQETTQKLLEYFFVGVSLPNSSFWVNLRPDSPNNIIDPYLAQTDAGKILLEADLQLKKDTAKFTSPENPKGKEYWDKLYKKAGELFGYDNITIPTLTRPWIVPDEIIIREANDNAYIYKATLKVQLEQDHLKDSAVYNFDDPRLKELNEYSSQLIRELIIPELTREINTSKRYATLRQVYYSLILAQWFKQKFYGKGGFYSWLIDRKDMNGLISKGYWSKDAYFKEYQKSFKDGEYNIKEPVYTPYGQTIRSYFSGGVALQKIPIQSISAEGSAIISPPYTVGALVHGKPDNIEITLDRKEPPKGTPATLLRYMYANGIFEDNPKKSIELSGQRGGNDSLRTIQKELQILKEVGLIEGSGRAGYYLSAWLKNISPEKIIEDSPELSNPSMSPEEIHVVNARVLSRGSLVITNPTIGKNAYMQQNFDYRKFWDIKNDEITAVEGAIKELVSEGYNEYEIRLIFNQHIRRLKQREYIDLTKDKWLGRLRTAFYMWKIRRALYDYHLVNIFGGSEELKQENVARVAREFQRLMENDLENEDINFVVFSGGSGVGNSTIWNKLMEIAPKGRFKKFIMYNTRDRRPDEDDDFRNDLDPKTIGRDLVRAIQIILNNGVERFDILNVTISNIREYKEALYAKLKLEGINLAIVLPKLDKILDLYKVGINGKRIARDEFVNIKQEYFAEYMEDKNTVSMDPPFAHKKYTSQNDEISLSERIGRLKNGKYRVYGEFDGLQYFFLPKGYLEELGKQGKVKIILFNKTDLQGISFKKIEEILSSQNRDTVYVLETISEFMELIKQGFGNKIRSYIVLPVEIIEEDNYISAEKSDIPNILIDRGYKILAFTSRGGSSSDTFLAENRDGKNVIIKYSDWEGISGNGSPWLRRQKDKLMYIQRKYPQQSRRLYPKVLDFYDDGKVVYYAMEYFEGAQDITQYFLNNDELSPEQMLQEVSDIVSVMVETHYSHPPQAPFHTYEGEIEANLFNRALYRMQLLGLHKGDVYARLLKPNKFRSNAERRFQIKDFDDYPDISYFFEDLMKRKTIVINSKVYPNMPILLKRFEENIDLIQSRMGPAHFSHYVHSDLSLRNILRLPNGDIKLIDVRGVNVNETSPSKVSIEYDLAKIAHSFFMEIVRNDLYELNARNESGQFFFDWKFDDTLGVERYLYVWRKYREILKNNPDLQKLLKFKSEDEQAEFLDYILLIECFNYLSDAIHRFSQDSSGKDSLIYYLQATVSLYEFLEKQKLLLLQDNETLTNEVPVKFQEGGIVAPALSIIKNQIIEIERRRGQLTPTEIDNKVKRIIQAIKSKEFEIKGEEVDILKDASSDEIVIGQIDRNIAENFEYIHRTANAIVLTPDLQHVVLTRRAHNKGQYPYYLTIPGGHLLSGQDYQDAIIDELKEELELTSLTGELLEVDTYAYGLDSITSRDKTKERRELFIYRLTTDEYQRILKREKDLEEIAKGENGKNRLIKELGARQFEGIGEVWSYHEVSLSEIENAVIGRDDGSPYGETRFLEINDIISGQKMKIPFTPDLLNHLVSNYSLMEKIKNIIKRIQNDNDRGGQANTKKGPGSISLPVDKKGGIDFRVLPIVSQQVNASAYNSLVLSKEQRDNVSFDLEWAQIENMINAGIVPSGQRIKDYLNSCCKKQELNQGIDKALSCIMDIMRLEEKQCEATDPALRELLVLLESGKPADQLEAALVNINFTSEEPQSY